MTDPRSNLPIMKKIMSVRVDVNSNAAFKESSRISLLRHFLSQLTWRLDGDQQIVEDFLAHLDHSYKGISVYVVVRINTNGRAFRCTRGNRTYFRSHSA
jgi:hypothetical protein